MRQSCRAWRWCFWSRQPAGRSASPRSPSPTQGFLYLVSRLGTTGTGQGPGDELTRQLALVRAHARTPVAVGFGLSRPEQVRQLAPQVDGLIVGSAVVERAAEGSETLRDYVHSLRTAL